jgi:hypothetical protein
MKLSVVFAAVLAANADAAAFQKRQNGNPDGTFDCYGLRSKSDSGPILLT